VIVGSGGGLKVGRPLGRVVDGHSLVAGLRA